jgi:hypothetical protein
MAIIEVETWSVARGEFGKYVHSTLDYIFAIFFVMETRRYKIM